MSGSFVSSSSMFSALGSAPSGRDLGFLLVAWYDLPEAWWIQRPQMRASKSSSGTHSLKTMLTLSFVSLRMASSFSAWPTVRGKPSSKNPPLQSSAAILSLMIAATRSSSTNAPLFITSSAFFPTSVPAATAARSMSPVDNWGVPNASTILGACVPLPEPGGPKRMMMVRPGSAGGAAVASAPSATVVTFAPSSVSSFVDSAMVLCGLPLVHAGRAN
mmetsp:Transcript_676/g.1850  ORF Transcript_676/g.1850 Transcript_676/m.1850 type:complete len:217 (+) Transcript_676:342-992(+)